MMRALHHAPSEAFPSGQAIEPRHGVIVVKFSILQQVQGLIEIPRLVMLHHQVRALDRNKSQGNFRHDSGQAHATDRGPEQFFVLLGRTPFARAVREDQLYFRDMIAQSSNVMMILSMHVGRHTSAQGNEFRPRGHNRKPAARNESIEHLGDGGSSLGP